MSRVVKIGGSLLSSGRDYINIASIIEDRFLRNSNERVFLVVSAARGVTDELISIVNGDGDAIGEIESKHLEAAEEIGDRATQEKIAMLLHQLRSALRDCSSSDRCYHEILSFGERLSAVLLEGAFRAVGIESRRIDALRALIASYRDGDLVIDYEASQRRLAEAFSSIGGSAAVFIMEGFIASLSDGRIVTLGRGGSDYTATAVAALLSAQEAHLITETEGIMSGDPKLFKNPRIVKALDISEAKLASIYGVKRLHPKTLEPLEVSPYPRKLFITSPEGRGTEICRREGCSGDGIKILALKNGSADAEIIAIGRNGAPLAVELISEELRSLQLPHSVEMFTHHLLSIRLRKSPVFFDAINRIHDKIIWGALNG